MNRQIFPKETPLTQVLSMSLQMFLDQLPGDTSISSQSLQQLLEGPPPTSLQPVDPESGSDSFSPALNLVQVVKTQRAAAGTGRQIEVTAALAAH
ncbi:MAG: hypothetical protein RIC12_00050 [Pirellulales bacterium]